MWSDMVATLDSSGFLFEMHRNFGTCKKGRHKSPTMMGGFSVVDPLMSRLVFYGSKQKIEELVASKWKIWQSSDVGKAVELAGGHGGAWVRQ